MTPPPLENATSGSPNPRSRKRFLLAVALFLAWVAILAAMDILSANRPGLLVAPTEVEQPESR